jgi:hypothetical protein
MDLRRAENLTPHLSLGGAAGYRCDIGAQFLRLRHCAKIFILTKVAG